MKRQAAFALLAALLLILLQGGTGLAQSSEDIRTLREEVEGLKEGQKEIQKNIEELKKLIQARPAPSGRPEFREAVIDIGGAPVKGEKIAKLVLIEFSDYQ